MVYCTNCGKAHDDDSNFCTACGRELVRPKQALTPTPAAADRVPTEQQAVAELVTVAADSSVAVVEPTEETTEVITALEFAEPVSAELPKLVRTKNKARWASIAAGVFLRLGIAIYIGWIAFFVVIGMFVPFAILYAFGAAILAVGQIIAATPMAIMFFIGRKKALLTVATGLPLLGVLITMLITEFSYIPDFFHCFGLISFFALGILAVIPKASRVNKYIWYIPPVTFMTGELFNIESITAGLNAETAMFWTASLCFLLAIWSGCFYIGRNADN